MSSPSVVVCREIFDENSQPSAEEISDYAQQLGIDPESESHLLPLAKDGLMQALPAPWKAYYDDKIDSHYYYNEETKKTQWEHPLDNIYRELVKKARDASMHDDTCASVQELPTSEEHTKNLERVETKVESDEELSTDSENQGTDAKDNSNIIGRRLTPLGRPPPSPLSRIDKKLSDTRISPLRRSVDGLIFNKPNLVRNQSDKDLLHRPFERPKQLFKQQSEIIDLKIHVLNSPEEEKFSPLLGSSKSERGLPLTGKGSMFLKVSKSDLPSPDTDKSLPLDSVTKSDPPKGILRDKLSDVLHKKVDSLFMKKQPLSLDEDRKSVRFKLENPPDPTLSPGSNSSSEQNDGQSSIISAPPIPSPNISPLILSPTTPSQINQFTQLNPLNQNSQMNQLNQIVLSPIVTRPPLPPRESPREVKNLSSSERDSVDDLSLNLPSPPSNPSQSASPTKPCIPRVLSPLIPKPDPLPYNNKEVTSKSSSECDSNESESLNRGTSPRRRILRPPAADYIKPDLFQKNFQKISDLVRPGDIETPASLEEPVLSEKEARPRSPMIPQKNKISINLMESIESETSIDSPDREFANLDLNDLDESNFKERENNEDIEKDSSKYSEDISNKNSEQKSRNDVQIPQIKVPTLDLSKTIHSDSEDSRKTSNNEEKSKFSEISNLKSPTIKISPTPSNDRSPKLDYTKTWSPLSTFKPLAKAPIKASDSASSLQKSLNSPRLDGVMLSQGKSNSDNVVVVYQFETQEESKTIKSPIPDMNRDLLERNKADERRRLELSLQKELEGIRVEWASRERRLRGELVEELREVEDKFVAEKRVRLSEQADRHKREMGEALASAEQKHKESLERSLLELSERVKRDVAAAERQHLDNLEAMRHKYMEKLREQERQLGIENERALTELREQYQADLNKERARMIEENRASIESLREEHTTKITELRHDYRAEVERLRSQHACHLEEVRSRLANERASSGKFNEERALQEKYKCLKEKYVRLKHDVKMSIERRNKRREMSMTTGSETEKSNSHKANQSLEKCKELNETSVSAVIEAPPRVNNNSTLRYNDNETSVSESNAHRHTDNNNREWAGPVRDHAIQSADKSQVSAIKQRPHRKTAVAFREPPRRRRDRDKDTGATTDCQDSSDATTADDKPKENINGHGRRRCFTRLKSASTSRLNYSPKRGEGWSSPLEALRQQLRKLDDLEDQFPDLACQPAYSLRYPFAELGAVATADIPELEFVRHRALVEREGVRRARAALRRRRAALEETRASLSPHRAPSEEREVTELEVALHRARALLGEKEIRLRHIERALAHLAHTPAQPAQPLQHRARALLGEKEIRLRHIERALAHLAHTPAQPAQPLQVPTTRVLIEATASEVSEASSGSEAPAEAGGAVLRSLRALHADVRDIWRALDARRPYIASPETSSCNATTPSQNRLTLSAPDPILRDNSDGSVAERARGLRAWLQTAP